MTTDYILTVNSGSSTIKFGMFEPISAQPSCLGKALLQLQTGPSEMRIALTTGDELTFPIVSPTEDLDSVIVEALGVLREAVGGGPGRHPERGHLGPEQVGQRPVQPLG